MKIGIVGTGMVGSATAYAMALRGVGTDIILVDQSRDLAEAHAQDISHAVPFGGPVDVLAGEYDDLKGAGIVVIAAGVSQKPGESRLALLGRNTAVFRDVIGAVRAVAPDAILLIASNPVDLMTYAAQRISGLDAGRVIGSGTILDTARFRVLLGAHLGIAPRSVHAYVIGEHGDSEVAVWSSAMAGSVPVLSFAEQTGRAITEPMRAQMTTAVRNAAYAIIKGKGATYYGIGAGLARIANAVISDEQAVLTVSTVTEDIEGLTDVPLSVPRIVGAKGVTAELRPNLDQAEHLALAASASTIAEYKPGIDQALD